MKLKPLGDRLIVRAVEEEETTASGASRLARQPSWHSCEESAKFPLTT